MKDTKRNGFASMDKEKQLEIARMGGNKVASKPGYMRELSMKGVEKRRQNKANKE
jgi:general stress protein YciG